MAGELISRKEKHSVHSKAKSIVAGRYTTCRWKQAEKAIRNTGGGGESGSHAQAKPRTTASGTPTEAPLAAALQPLAMNPRLRTLVNRIVGLETAATITAAHIAAICENMRSLNPNYRSKLVYDLRQILRRIGRHDCEVGLPRLKKAQPREVTVATEEFEKVARTAGPALELAMLLSRDAAIRIGTVCALRVDQLDFKNNLINGSTKNNRRFNVPMTSRLRERLLFAAYRAKEPSDTVLGLYRTNRKAFGRDALEVQLKRARVSAGLKTSWGFHDLRRTAARALYNETKDIRKVQRLLAHANVATTFWYLGNATIDLTGEEIERSLNK